MQRQNSLRFAVFLFLFYFRLSHSWYIITTPRKWIVNEDTQVCLTLDQLATPSDAVNIELKSDDGNSTILPQTKFPIIPGRRSQCHNVQLPSTVESQLKLHVSGEVTGKAVNHSETVGVAKDVHETYIQTDKYLYKPGGTVKFRVLSVSGPMLTVETGQYDEMWIENPSKTRIAQWLNVSNKEGLIHGEFTLSDEPAEGVYKIKVRTPFSSLVTADFKVEEYVLPRFEVSITPPNFILGTSKNVPFTVCAKYTFGQPVKGQLRLKVDNSGWGRYKVEAAFNRTMTGCETVVVQETEINLNNKDYYVYNLKARAEVEEEGTGVVLSAKEVTAAVTRTAIAFEDVSVQEFLKPELPFLVEVKATFPDKSPAKNEPMKVCDFSQEEICKTFLTDEKGLLKYLVPPHLDRGNKISAVNYPRIKDSESSWRSVMYESSHRINFKKYHSPSNSSLILFLTEKSVVCEPGKTMELEVPVKFSASNQKEAYVTVQVVSRGQVQFSSTSNVKFIADAAEAVDEALFLAPMRAPVTRNAVRGTFTLRINLPETVSPDAKIVLWYVRDDGEVVSDYRDIDITECLPHSASLTWSVEKAEPGETVGLQLQALPNSLCSVGVVDKSVELLAPVSNKLTVSKLLQVAQKGVASDHEFSQVNDYEYCKQKEAESTTLPPGGGIPPIGPPIAEPETNKREKRSRPFFGGPFRRYYSDDVDAIHGFDKAGLFVFSDLTLETRPCNSRPYEHVYFAYGGIEDRFIGMPGTAHRRPRPPAAPAVVQFSPASGDGASGENEEQSSSRTHFPETWLWNLVHLTSSGISEETPVLPDTITEWTGQAVCVHPSGGVGVSGSSSIITFRDFFADLTLPASVKRGEVFPVKISVFNYLKEPLPIKVELYKSPEYEILTDEVHTSGERFSCVAKEDKYVHSIRIKPTVFGDVNITVLAYVDINAIEDCGATRTEKKFRSDLMIKPIKVEIEGFEKEETYSKYICDDELLTGEDGLDEWNMAAPAGIIENSDRGWVSVVGDLMGPTLENLGGLIKMPYGCGEQNMLNFAPNIFVMQYLDSSNQNTKEVSAKSIKFMEKGYQRELQYRHKDGSFSAFGKSDASGSTWLTAFVLKCFAQARPYIAVDEKDLEKTSTWLKNLQQENGCFESVGKVLHKGMKGGVDKSKSQSLLTAFILISLLEAGESANSRAVTEALYCLLAEPLSASDPYALAVRTYALALSGHERALEGAEALLAGATVQGPTMYWKLPESLESGKGISVETSGYAALGLLALDATRYAVETRKIIKWINNQRNGQGGFVSTQDTIVALQALAAYEKQLPQGPIDLVVLVDMRLPASAASAVFNVDETNKLLLQRSEIPSFPANVAFSIEGKGCALIQGTLRYNVPEEEHSPGFDVNVTTTTEYDVSCKTKRIDVCSIYTLADKTSNMAILEVELISGYIPEKEDLKDIVGAGTGVLKRYEVDGRKVTFYFDELTDRATCLSFRVLREVEVENPKPGSVSVYDYYKPELFVKKSFTLPGASECITELPPPPVEKQSEREPLVERVEIVADSVI